MQFIYVSIDDAYFTILLVQVEFILIVWVFIYVPSFSFFYQLFESLYAIRTSFCQNFFKHEFVIFTEKEHDLLWYALLIIFYDVIFSFTLSNDLFQ